MARLISTLERRRQSFRSHWLMGKASASRSREPLHPFSQALRTGFALRIEAQWAAGKNGLRGFGEGTVRLVQDETGHQAHR